LGLEIAEPREKSVSIQKKYVIDMLKEIDKLDEKLASTQMKYNKKLYFR
jgi:hypothetical protein